MSREASPTRYSRPRLARSARRGRKCGSPGPPDDVGPERDRGQAGRVRREHHPLGQRLGPWVGGRPPGGVRRGLVDAVQVGAVVHHARAGGVHQPRHPELLAGVQDVARAEHVDRVVLGHRPPGARHGRAVHDGVAAVGRRQDVGAAPDVPGALFHAVGVRPRPGAAVQRAHLVARLGQPSAHRPAEEAAAARHQHPHRPTGSGVAAPARRNLPIRRSVPYPGANTPCRQTTSPAMHTAGTAASLRLTIRDRPSNSAMGASW